MKYGDLLLERNAAVLARQQMEAEVTPLRERNHWLEAEVASLEGRVAALEKHLAAATGSEAGFSRMWDAVNQASLRLLALRAELSAAKDAAKAKAAE